MNNSVFQKIWYGGDYNPDQWSSEVWQEDIRLFKEAGIDLVTLPVFSWAKLQPSETEYRFDWLDDVLNLLGEHEIGVCLATSTGAHPAWMAHRHPDILRVDFAGRKRAFGQRQNSCPNSLTYRNYAPQLAGRLAKRYHDHPVLTAWHVSNEFGGYCYCDQCAAAFRGWLRDRYGSLDEVNLRWSTGFWGHTFYSWEEIVPPNLLSEHVDEADETCTAFQAISLDYNRFMSDSLLTCYRLEKQAIRKYSDKPVTTNLMGAYKPLNYFQWAKEMDFISWDSYPSNREHPANVALRHVLMRSLKGGAPFVLMEQTPSQVNWHDYNSLKRPGVMRLWSYQAMAQGADGLLFFQMRQSVGASEKFHGAVIPHAGHSDTRVFREVAGLGEELRVLGCKTIGTRVEASVALLFDWENWWALEYSMGPTKELTYIPQIEKYFRAFWDRNIPVDFVSPDHALDRYDLVVTPTAYLLHPGQANRLREFVAEGGTLLTTLFSGIVDENDRVQTGGYPAELRDVLGVWVEEHDPLFPDMENAIVVSKSQLVITGRHRCRVMCERIHAEGAEVIGTYESDFYAGTPALTRHVFGNGVAWYVGTDLAQESAGALVAEICRESQVFPIMDTPSGVEVTRRTRDRQTFTFVLNHNAYGVLVPLPDVKAFDLLTGEVRSGEIKLPPYGVRILGGERAEEAPQEAVSN
mgnify:CR=1 FL=1